MCSTHERHPGRRVQQWDNLPPAEIWFEGEWENMIWKLKTFSISSLRVQSENKPGRKLLEGCWLRSSTGWHWSWSWSSRKWSWPSSSCPSLPSSFSTSSPSQTTDLQSDFLVYFACIIVIMFGIFIVIAISHQDLHHQYGHWSTSALDLTLGWCLVDYAYPHPPPPIIKNASTRPAPYHKLHSAVLLINTLTMNNWCTAMLITKEGNN